MTHLLDILKETELRIRFSEAFRTIGSREVLSPDVFQRRLLLWRRVNNDSAFRFSIEKIERGLKNAPANADRYDAEGYGQSVPRMAVICSMTCPR
jgi:hypothetical protein